MLSPKMTEALELAKLQQGFINKYQLHYRTKEALCDRGLLKRTSGYGWQFGQLLELTDEGKEAIDR